MAENPIQMFTNRLNWARGEKDIKINRVQIENNFGFDFVLYDDG